MNDTFRPFLRKFILVFFDDILVYSKNMSDHENHLKQVLSVLLFNYFVANQSKCKFGCQQIDYLGHIIYGTGVSIDPENSRCIMVWSEPKNVKGVHGFLAKPFTEMTKKDKFK